MVNILQIIDGKSFGGITTLMREVEKKISSEIKMDFLTACNICPEWHNLNADRSSISGRILYNLRLYKFLKKNKYDIIHINSGAFFFTFFCALTCRVCGIKKIIVHSHNTPRISKTKKILITLLNPIYRKLTSAHLSCSKEASLSLFTKTDDVAIIKNGVDVDKYKFNETTRKKYRKKLDLEGKIVYGHVGRFHRQKNHEFLIDVFYEIQKKQDSILLLIGRGELEDQIQKKVHKLKIDNKVIFLGFREDINNLLNAMDIFLFPSMQEGLPISVIEAQTSGLPTFVSNAIPEEANISDNFYRIDTFDATKWTNKILNVKLQNRSTAYMNTINAGFDIEHTVSQLYHIYKAL